MAGKWVLRTCWGCLMLLTSSALQPKVKRDIRPYIEPAISNSAFEPFGIRSFNFGSQHSGFHAPIGTPFGSLHSVFPAPLGTPFGFQPFAPNFPTPFPAFAGPFFPQPPIFPPYFYPPPPPPPPIPFPPPAPPPPIPANPIVVPASTAAALSVASLIHALIAKKFYPPVLPFPVPSPVPVPFPIKIQVPVAVDRPVPVTVLKPIHYETEHETNETLDNWTPEHELHEDHPTEF